MEWLEWMGQTGSNTLFALSISPIPFHSHFSFFSTFQILQTIPFHSIFFQPFFFNFPNPYTISLNLNHSYQLEIRKVKQFLHHFYKSFSNYYKPFSNHFFPPQKWSKMAKIAKPNKRLFKKIWNFLWEQKVSFPYSLSKITSINVEY